MASYGSTPLFHIVGITPEAPTIEAVSGTGLSEEKITAADIAALRDSFAGHGDQLDVVVLAAPQLSLFEMHDAANHCAGRRVKKPLIVCTSPQVYGDATRMGFVATIEDAGGTVLHGTCFYNQYAREIGEANGWVNLLSNSAKIVNILGGYGYRPALASMRDCIEAAIEGKMA